MRNAKLKRVCQAGIMIGSLLLTGLVSDSAHDSDEPIHNWLNDDQMGSGNILGNYYLCPTASRPGTTIQLAAAAIRQRAVKCSHS